MNTPSRMLAITLIAVLSGCNAPSEPTQSELVLPAGDAKLGEAAFMGMRCYDCHRIPGVELPVAEEPNQVLVTIGGDDSKVASYAELVTSIINPSHQLATGYTKQLVATGDTSNMTNYNQAMTVAELINIVAYLEQHYGVTPTRGPE